MEKNFTDVGAFLDTVSDLPVLPSNIQKITDIMSDESKSAEDISAVIATDQGLTSKVLKIANSAFYGRVSQVVKISESVVVIGLLNIKSMLYAIFMEQLYGGAKDDGKMLSSMWIHSISSAILSQRMIEKVNPGEKDTAYTAGLLHDIGELIIFKYEPGYFNEILVELKNEQMLPRTTIEETIMGFTHSDLGAAMARKWSLPRAIKNAIFFHHNPAECDTDNAVVSVVHMADVICCVSGISGTDRQPDVKDVMKFISKKAMENVNFGKAEIEYYISMMGDIRAEADKLIESVKGGR
jgi:putative nucleotidyltransferase with HDIG domain